MRLVSCWYMLINWCLQLSVNRYSLVYANLVNGMRRIHKWLFLCVKQYPGCPGSHIVIRCGDQNLNDELVMDAAALSAVRKSCFGYFDVMACSLITVCLNLSLIYISFQYPFCSDYCSKRHSKCATATIKVSHSNTKLLCHHHMQFLFLLISFFIICIFLF